MGAVPDVFVLPGERYFNILAPDLTGQMDLVLPLLELHQALGVEAAQPSQLPLGEGNIGDLHISQVADSVRMIVNCDHRNVCCVLSLSPLQVTKVELLYEFLKGLLW